MQDKHPTSPVSVVHPHTHTHTHTHTHSHTLTHIGMYSNHHQCHTQFRHTYTHTHTHTLGYAFKSALVENIIHTLATCTDKNVWAFINVITSHISHFFSLNIQFLTHSPIHHYTHTHTHTAHTHTHKHTAHTHTHAQTHTHTHRH